MAVPYGEDSEPPFRAGKVAMFQNGRWATPGVRTVDFNWDVVELPKGPSGSMGNWLFWGAYVINANTEHPEEAWQLIQALTTAETQGKVSALGTNIPSRVSQEALDAFLTFTPPDNNQAFLNGLSDNPAVEGPLWTTAPARFAARARSFRSLVKIPVNARCTPFSDRKAPDLSGAGRADSAAISSAALS